MRTAPIIFLGARYRSGCDQQLCRHPVDPRSRQYTLMRHLSEMVPQTAVDQSAAPQCHYAVTDKPNSVTVEYQAGTPCAVKTCAETNLSPPGFGGGYLISP
jgi:hypothetical protein